MKKVYHLVLFIILFSTISVSGQDKLNFTEVIAVDSTSRDQLYDRAKTWFVITFISANDVLQMDDAEDGQIIAQAIMNYNSTLFNSGQQTNGIIRYSVKIFLKEGRYKYEITDFIHDPHGNIYGQEVCMGLITTADTPPEGRGSNKWRTKVWNDIKSQIEVNVLPLIVSLKSGMITPTEASSDDW